MPSHPAADAHPATSLLPISQHPPPCVWRHGSEANDDENTSPSTDMHTHCLQAQRRPTDIQLEHQNGTAQPSTHPSTLAHPPRLTPAGPNNPPKTPIENGRGYQPHPALPTRKDMRTHPPRPPPDSDHFGATTACVGSARMERCRRSGSQWTEHRLAVPSPSPSALGIVRSFPFPPQR